GCDGCVFRLREVALEGRPRTAGYPNRKRILEHERSIEHLVGRAAHGHTFSGQARGDHLKACPMLKGQSVKAWKREMLKGLKRQTDKLGKKAFLSSFSPVSLFLFHPFNISRSHALTLCPFNECP